MRQASFRAMAVMALGAPGRVRQIAQKVPQHSEAHLLGDLPGAGAVLVPRLIVALGTQRDRYESAAELAAYSGIAPVTRRSGQSKSVHFRRLPQFLRQTFHEFAAHSVSKSVWAQQYYRQQRSRGMRHHAALRALALKWVRILFRWWKDRTPYDDARYVRTLQLRSGAQKCIPGLK
jgi:transposase